MALACIVETSGQNLMKLCMHHVHCTPTEGVYHYIGKELSILQKKGLIFFNFAIFTLDFLVYLRAKRVTDGGLLQLNCEFHFGRIFVLGYLKLKTGYSEQSTIK